MATVVISDTDLRTADEDPELWNVLWVANRPVPGICLPLEGERKRDTKHTKAKGSSRDILTDNGLEPSECTVRIKTVNGEVYRALYEFYLAYMDPDRSLSRRAIVPVSNPQLYVRGIKLAYFFAAPLPAPSSETGVRPMIHEFRFNIVGPNTQISSGGSKSTKPKIQTPVGGPTDPNFRASRGSGAVGSLIAGAKSLANFIPGFGDQVNQGPPASAALAPGTILTPAQIQLQASAGDPTAKFVVDLFQGAAP